METNCLICGEKIESTKKKDVCIQCVRDILKMSCKHKFVLGVAKERNTAPTLYEGFLFCEKCGERKIFY